MFAILKKLKGLGLSGGDSKTLNLATLAPQMAQILRFWKIEGFRPVWGGFKNVKFSHPKWLNFCDVEKIEWSRPVWGGFKNVKFSNFGTPSGLNFAILEKLTVQHRLLDEGQTLLCTDRRHASTCALGAHVSYGVRAHAHLRAVDLKSTP